MSAVLIENRFDNVDPGRAGRVLLWAIFAFVVVFIVWASLATVDRVTLAEGRVIPSSQLQTISNLEGGIVEAILAKPGARVKIGDPLIRLRPVVASAEFARREVESLALDAKLTRLRAEMRGERPVYSTAFRAQANDLVTIEEAIYVSRMADLDAAVSAVSARRDQAAASARSSAALLASRRAAQSNAERQLAILRPLVERGVEPRLSLIQAESQAAQTSAETAAAASDLVRARSGVAEAQAVIAQQRAAWRTRSGQELAQTQASSSAERRTLPALADRLARTTLRAPLSGMVNRVLVSTVGGAVRPGETLVEIVPEQGRLVVEARVQTSDIASIRLDQPANVKLTAYDYAIYGGLKGRVTGISPDAVVPQGRDQQSYYIIRVETEQDALLDAAGERLPIGPGMVAQVDLLGEKRSILSYILLPISKLGATAFRE